MKKTGSLNKNVHFRARVHRLHTGRTARSENMDSNFLHYFAGGNTAKGFYNLFDSNLQGLERVFILSGKSKTAKSRLIERLAEEWGGKGHSLEVIHSAHDHHSLDGLIIRKLGFGIVDGHPPRVIGKEFVGARWETVDLEVLGAQPGIEDGSAEVDILKEEINSALETAYGAYEEALKIHDDWESIYIGRMDFQKADRVADRLIKDLFGRQEKGIESCTRRRFLGAATPAGAVDFVENLTEGLSRRFFLKGRAGTGKSTLLKKIAAEAERRGYVTEIYHCGFDPNSLDMVLVRELGWAIFDSTAPHEYFPEREGDEIVDMYELTVAPGTDEMFAKEIADIEAEYRRNMTEANNYLAEAKRLQDQLEIKLAEGKGRTYLDDIFADINGEIKLLAKQGLL